MRITIEDLEALKELSDELEENHVETEKALQEDLEAKEAQIRDLQRKIDALEETCLDYEGTIAQFRELVMQLQTYVFCHSFLSLLLSPFSLTMVI